ncbi:hypothetical protein PIROE2DRAFT_61640 [Piromyces sp. E2]|nr:hypothetical protein PIROE2DRAFT_61640 [Piromyces sp. E2]|eukprot:OUM62809.1 hypothetical protein PIROE2DRAFT_61640 [Piromyces sp. E2]
MSVGIMGDNTKTPLIILPGFGSASPVLEFKPLAEKLSDQFQIFIIEPFGYGVSDGNPEDKRILFNVVNELHHITSEKLHLNRYYLMAHSLGGLYSLYWANAYPDEILGFIGIDISVAGMDDTDDSDNYLSIGKEAKYGTILLSIFDILGITRLVSYFIPEFIYLIDENYEYTKEERKIIRALTLCHKNNKTLWKEGEAIDDNLKELNGLTFPKDLPILLFLASDNVNANPAWYTLHSNIMYNTDKNKIIVLSGNHYLHLNNKENISKMVKEWIPPQSL